MSISFYASTISSYVVSLWRSMVASTVTKALGALVVSMLGFLFGYDNTQILEALFVLVMIDMITGIWAAHKQGEVVSSRKALKTGTKVLVYSMFIAASNMMTIVIPWANFTVPVVVAFLVITEFISVVENSAKLGYTVPQRLLNLNIQTRKNILQKEVEAAAKKRKKRG